MFFGHTWHTILYALLGGLIPALLWLFFWLREDDQEPEPRGLLFFTFVIGMAAVIVVIPIQGAIETLVGTSRLTTILWAGAEEVIKLLFVAFVALRSRYNNEPVDAAIYLITGALGFAALENTFYLFDPIAVKDTTVSLMTGNLRFLGSMLLHAVSSGVIGVMLGLAFYKNLFVRSFALIVGLGGAIALHSTFNFFIIDESRSLISVFAFLWVVAVIVMLLFERLRSMGDY